MKSSRNFVSLVGTCLKDIWASTIAHLRETFSPLRGWKKRHQTLIRWGIIGFCLWHMTAVFSFSLSPEHEQSLMRQANRLITTTNLCLWNRIDEPADKDAANIVEKLLIKARLCTEPNVTTFSVQNWINGDVRPHFYRYMMTTSQWQRWNLFSPNPMRRVISYHLEYWDGSAWQEFVEESNDTTPWWKRAYYLKTLRRIDRGSELDAIYKRLLSLRCKEYGIPPETPVRMRRQLYVIPMTTGVLSSEWWQRWRPQWDGDIMSEMTCPYRT